MKKALTLVVMIIIIVALSIVLGLVIGHVYQKRFNTEENMMIKEMCKLQIYKSSDKNKLEYTKNVIEKFGYSTIITKIKENDKTVYCLRLVDTYTIMEANKIINKIKKEFPFLEDKNFYTFRIEEKVKKTPVKVVPEEKITEKVADLPTSNKLNKNKFYEIQLFSDVLYSSIETLQFKVERKGYHTTISKAKINGSLIYRLRLDEHYHPKDGDKIINKLRRDFPKLSGIELADIDNGAEIIPRDEDIFENISEDLSENLSEDFNNEPIVKKIVEANKLEAKELEAKKLEGNKLEGEKASKSVAGSTKNNITEAAQQSGRQSERQSGNYEIQLLASPDLDKVHNLQNRLKKFNYETKITNIVIKSTKYYRLRLKKSYDAKSAKEMEKRIKDEVSFIKSCWIVKTDFVAKETKNIPAKQKNERKDKEVKRDTKFPYPTICQRDNINIRKGPGTNFAVDTIGKLMKGVEIYIQKENGGWIEFTWIQSNSKWSGWALKKLVFTDK